MNGYIRHEGIVTAVNGGEACVKIVQTSACAACHAKGTCMAADAQEKVIDCRMTAPLVVGDRAQVEVREGLGWLAIVLAFGLPFIWLMVAVWILGVYFSEGVAGTLGLCSLAIYFGGLSLFRTRLKRRFTFTASPLTVQTENRETEQEKHSTIQL